MDIALKLLPRLKKATVLCLGDVMLDCYLYGKVDRISPEAPVPVVKVTQQRLMPGGVGNVVKNLGAFGAHPLTVSLTGDDSKADLLMELLTETTSSPPVFIRDPKRPTSVKTRVIAGIQQVVRFDEEDESPLTNPYAQDFIAAAAKLIPKAGALVLSDYGKGTLTDDILPKIIGLAQAAGKPVVVDPKGRDYGRYRGATLVTPNRAELAEAVGRPLKTAEELTLAGQELMETCGLENLLITRSEDGVMLLSGQEPKSPVLLPSLARAVYDVSGAGDTVVAVMAAALALEAPLVVGARLANLAAGVVVGKVGTATATPKEITTWAKEANLIQGR